MNVSEDLGTQPFDDVLINDIVNENPALVQFNNLASFREYETSSNTFRYAAQVAIQLLQKKFPELAHSLNLSRGNNLKIIEELNRKLNSHNKNSTLKETDEVSERERKLFLDQRKANALEKVQKNTIFNYDRENLLPKEVADSIKALKLSKFLPIDDNGDILFPISNLKTSSKYNPFDKNGNWKKLNLASFRYFLKSYDSIPQKIKEWSYGKNPILNRIPEYKILSQYIKNPKMLSKTITKLNTEKANKSNPKKMGNRLFRLWKKAKETNEHFGGKVGLNDLKKWIAPKDWLSYNLLNRLENSDVNVIPNSTQSAKPYVYELMRSGKLTTGGMRKIANSLNAPTKKDMEKFNYW